MERLMMKAQSNEGQKEYAIAKKIVYGDDNTMAHLCKVSEHGFLIPWHSKCNTKNYFFSLKVLQMAA